MAEKLEDIFEALALFLHLLMMATTLISRSSAQISRHHLKDLLRSPQVLPLEVHMMVQEELIVLAVLGFIPVPSSVVVAVFGVGFPGPLR